MHHKTLHQKYLLAPSTSAIILLSAAALSSMPAYAGKSDIETAGDIVMVAIPALAYGSTFYMDDAEGRNQFYKSFATNAVATYGLKKAIDRERPDHSDNDSFPSAHTSIAFQGASFIHKRYGFEYSIPAYVGATFVGYSRIDADKHHTTDVLAGAALGVASSMLLTKSYYDDTLHISANLAPESYQLAVHYRF
ncbi:phosphatase PAP2 family protein [Psychrobacter lutiphocae]|uniref:phosphatase PAP2 family protein n=1 Tax=Psychrobacter lutiphocae TaxID=540500 RepID=UPI00037DF043|nr:phosphatase PAP2 family protein [Psychrobacter lutiphocae]